jgi:hypothetical protein
LAIVQQWQGLSAVAADFGNGIRVAGRVDQDGQVVRQQQLGSRVQAGFDLHQAAEPNQRLVDRGPARDSSRAVGTMPPQC